MICKDCKYFKEDFEYKGMGDCNNKIAMDKIVVSFAEMFLISEDFGCIHFEKI